MQAVQPEGESSNENVPTNTEIAGIEGSQENQDNSFKNMMTKVDVDHSDDERDFQEEDPLADAASSAKGNRSEEDSDSKSKSEGESSEAEQPQPQRRRRRRSRSRSVAVERRAGQASASGDEDLTLYMSMRKIDKLSEPAKAKLRQVVRSHNRQTKFNRFLEKSAFQPISLLERYRFNASVHSRLVEFAEPIPTATAFIDGIDHRNNNPSKVGQKWCVPRAIHSSKMHYLTKIQREMIDRRGQEFAFAEQWPKIYEGILEKTSHHNWANS